MRALAVIPAFDEEETVGAVVAGVRTAGLDVLVVDDGSADATAERAAAAGARVVRLERNRGKGEALRRGFREALAGGYDAVVTLDADLQHDPADAPRLVAALEASGADVAVGTRVRSWRRMPIVRRATNAAMSIVISLVTGLRFTDTQCGLRALSRRALERLPLRSPRFGIESEIALRGAAAGLTFAELPVATIYRAGRKSRIRVARDTAAFFALVARTALLPRRGSSRVIAVREVTRLVNG